ncbi:hypothetical protein NM688_g1846 [Phlebia brevispora]|uniref:Uncharacterized protein n=1 Tax=Phlebia brevispora TaxID=194682 RepID=A0ACC1TAD5_9APHY|nr:hypothetical protein NM688_g1846 [Phlebia brevispora]
MSGQEYDRKSAVSSFYDRRRSSVDVLNQDFPSPSTPHYGQPERTRHDSASSFYNPNGPSRTSAEHWAQQPPAAGYNSSSYFDAGRTEPVKGGYDEERDEPFDIYADFNNTGPRYSKATFGLDNGYRPVNSPSFKLESDTTSNTGAPVEMVTVPALGPEWGAEEMRGMTKRGKREVVNERRAQKWKEWRRGERGLCGRYFTRKFLAWFLFFFCGALGLTLVFVVPRVPGFQFNQDTPLTNASVAFNKTVPTEFSRAPANFSFPASADLQVDTGSNFLPLVFSWLHATVYDLSTNREVGTGVLGHMTFPAKQQTQLYLPLNFSYVATNDSDQTWNNWYNACKNPAIYSDGTRPPVQFRLTLDFKIDGLIGTKHDAADITNAACPITLPINSV